MLAVEMALTPVDCAERPATMTALAAERAVLTRVLRLADVVETLLVTVVDIALMLAVSVDSAVDARTRSATTTDVCVDEAELMAAD